MASTTTTTTCSRCGARGPAAYVHPRSGTAACSAACALATGPRTGEAAAAAAAAAAGDEPLVLVWRAPTTGGRVDFALAHGEPPETRLSDGRRVATYTAQKNDLFYISPILRDYLLGPTVVKELPKVVLVRVAGAIPEGAVPSRWRAEGTGYTGVYWHQEDEAALFEGDAGNKDAMDDAVASWYDPETHADLYEDSGDIDWVRAVPLAEWETHGMGFATIRVLGYTPKGSISIHVEGPNELSGGYNHANVLIEYINGALEEARKKIVENDEVVYVKVFFSRKW